MKKLIGKLVVCVLAALMAVSFAACSNSKTIEDYVKSSEVQSQITELKEDLKDSGMDIEVKGEGDKLIYVYTIDSAYVVDGLAEELEKALTAQSSVFEEVASTLKEATNVSDPIVVVQYVDSDGNEIHSQEFKAK
mgnify:CR=1 FL=1